MPDILILIVTAATAALLFWPRVSGARLWRAAITPLASIIGSGFLILGPILEVSYGAWAPAAMALLCLVAYLFGNAIRFNIATRADGEHAPGGLESRLETAASWALAFAYFISVAYYLNLFGAFAVSKAPLNDPFWARIVTSAMFALIVAVGWFKGFHALERLEQISVGAKLAIIAGLLFGLAWFFAGRVSGGGLIVNPLETSGWAAITLGFGLIVTVQGFETSRYLGEEYDATTRIRSMRLAQIVASAIYMTYVLLIAFLFEAGSYRLTETAIIDLMGVVAPILPFLLIAAALSAQFSAAVADTSGSGGLVTELTASRVSPKQAYAILTVLGLVLTWSLDIFEIISYASRAFAFYYALQSAIAATAAWRIGGQRPRAACYAALALLGIAIAIFGEPVE